MSICNGFHDDIFVSRCNINNNFDTNTCLYKLNIYLCTEMLKAYKYRLSPNKTQAELINKHIGSARFVYNLALETKQAAYISNRFNMSCFDLVKQLPDLKKECDWLKEVNSQTLQQSIVNLDVAFNSFFKGKSDFPKFKSKYKSRLSFQCPQSAEVDFKTNKLFLPKFKKGIDIVLHRDFVGIIKTVTISKTPTGKYFASILVDNKNELPNKAKVKEKTTIGIDLGIKSFLVTSDGQEFDNPKYLRVAESKLKYIQRKYSKNKGKRTKYRLAMQHEKVVNQRKDFLHKVSSKLISENQAVAIEDLNIKGMIKNHCLAKSIGDAGWGMFVDMLEYKASWQGKSILRIGRFEPSSKVCSCCGSVNKELTLKDREWTCKYCGTLLNRDVNAAINIKSFALKNNSSVEYRPKNRNELPTLVGVLTSEAPTPLG